MKSASWIVVQGEKVLANQHGEEFAEEFPTLLKSTLESLFNKSHVYGSLIVHEDGSSILTIQATDHTVDGTA